MSSAGTGEWGRRPATGDRKKERARGGERGINLIPAQCAGACRRQCLIYRRNAQEWWKGWIIIPTQYVTFLRRIRNLFTAQFTD